MPPTAVLLLVTPIALLLAGLALGAGERRARAQRARKSLGAPHRRVEEATAGERVVLEGRLEVLEGPCERFEDGAPAAAITVDSAAVGIIPEDLKVPVDAADPVILTDSARAAVLALVVGGERVLLEGPIEVVVGSDETDPHVPFTGLAPAVRGRIVGLVRRSALPAPSVPDAANAWPRFRSVRASGASIVAAGVLTQRSDGERTGYRGRAPWVLHGEGGAPILVAFTGTPRHVGPLGAMLRGVRPFGWLPRTAAVALVVGLAALLAFVGQIRPGATSQPPRSQSLGAAPRRPLADPARCGDLKRQHEAAVRKLASCTTDAECSVEVRGGVYFELEGCYRYRNSRLPAAETIASEKAWLEQGCATSYEVCPLPPLVMCHEGQCMERPPSPIPETWRREDVPGGFYLYLPPDVRRTSARGEDSIVAEYRGAGMLISSDFGERAVAEANDEDDDSDGAPMKIGGYDAKVIKTARAITVSFAHGKACTPPRCPVFLSSDSLTLRAECETDGACKDAWLALQSVRFW